MANNSFSRRIQFASGRISANVERIVRGAALVLDTEVVTRTPVDTGRARSNWLVSIGQPILQPIEPYAPGDAGSTAGVNVNMALQQGSEAIGRYRISNNLDIFVTNNVPYILRLDEGWSLQAPPDYVGSCVSVAQAWVRRQSVLRGI